MADTKEKKKKKKKEADEAPAAAPAPEPAPKASKKSKRSSKRGGSSVFSCFSQQQVNEFKEGFSMMDADKDGILTKSDIRSAFDIIGHTVSDDELDQMLADAQGPINFTMMLSMFASRQSGEADDDETVINAFKAFDDGDGFIDTETFRPALMTFGDKFSAKEVKEAFEQFEVNASGKIEVATVLEMLVGSKKEGEEAA